MYPQATNDFQIINISDCMKVKIYYCSNTYGDVEKKLNEDCRCDRCVVTARV